MALLVVSRMEEIAHFAALGTSGSYLTRFILFQIPYILPIAIPLSCLISAMILFQHLSRTREMIALRTSGMRLRQIVAPILVASAFFSLGTFYITSELATSAHLATRQMLYEMTSKNPLILLQSAKIAALKGAYVQMDSIKSGRAVQDLLIAVGRGDHLALCLARQVSTRDEELVGQGVSLISNSSHLVIENEEDLSTSAPEFAHFLRGKGWKLANDHLTLSLLRTRAKQLDPSKRAFIKTRSELVRRCALGLSAFTFTLMGVAFGIEIGRNKRIRGVLVVLCLTATTLVAFFIGKEFDHLIKVAATFFLLPQLVIVAASIYTLKKVSRGIE